MELSEVMNADIAIPVVGVVLCALLVFAFGFKSQVQPPNFEWLEGDGKHRKWKSKKQEKEKKLLQSDSISENQSSPAKETLTKRTPLAKSNASGEKAESVTPKIKTNKASETTAASKALVKTSTPAVASAVAKSPVALRESDGDWSTALSKKGKKEEKKERAKQKTDESASEDEKHVVPVKKVTSSPQGQRQTGKGPAGKNKKQESVDVKTTVLASFQPEIQKKSSEILKEVVEEELPTKTIKQGEKSPAKDVEKSRTEAVPTKASPKANQDRKLGDASKGSPKKGDDSKIADKENVAAKSPEKKSAEMKSPKKETKPEGAPKSPKKETKPEGAPKSPKGDEKVVKVAEESAKTSSEKHKLTTPSGEILITTEENDFEVITTKSSKKKGKVAAEKSEEPIKAPVVASQPEPKAPKSPEHSKEKSKINKPEVVATTLISIPAAVIATEKATHSPATVNVTAEEDEEWEDAKSAKKPKKKIRKDN